MWNLLFRRNRVIYIGNGVWPAFKCVLGCYLVIQLAINILIRYKYINWLIIIIKEIFWEVFGGYGMRMDEMDFELVTSFGAFLIWLRDDSPLLACRRPGVP